MKQFLNFYIIIFIASIFIKCSSDELSKTVWVENGKLQAVIIIADKPYEIASYAANELGYHIKLATGLSISVKSESDYSPDDGNRIFIGQSNAAKKAGINWNKLESEQFVILKKENDLFIVGNDTEGDPLDSRNNNSGTLWGVYEVIEQILGVRWLWPGELGTVVPKTDHIEIGQWNKVIKPVLSRRNIRTFSQNWNENSPFKNGFSSKEAYDNYKKDERIFLRRHRMGRSDDPRPYTGHSFNNWWSEYGNEHPEWFQKLPESKMANEWKKQYKSFYPIYNNIPENGWENYRGPVKYDDKLLTSMCVSNTKLHHEIINRWKEQRENNQAIKHIIHIGENDTPALCTCDNCTALDEPQLNADEFKQLPEYVKVPYTPMNAGRRYALFWKNIHQLAQKEDQDVIVTAFIYFNYFVAPEDVKLHKNIILGFVPWDEWWFPRDPNEQKWLYEQWQKWQNTGATLYYRPNYMLNGGSMPHVFARQMADELTFFCKNGAIGTDFDSMTGQWAVNGTTLYLLCRLQNLPNISTEELLDEYYCAFGPAALQIKAYFDFWESHTNLIRAMSGFGGSLEKYNQYIYKIFPPESFKQAKSILNKALNNVINNDNKQYELRIKFLQKGLEHAEKEAILSNLFNEADTNEKALINALQDLIEFRHENEYLNIANFYFSAFNDISSWGDKINSLISKLNETE